MFKVSAVASVYRHRSPSVRQNPHFRGSSVDHRLNRQHHTSLQAWPLALRTKIGNLGILMHAATNPVAHKLPDYAKPLGLAYLLHSSRDIAQATPNQTLLYRCIQRSFRNLKQSACPWGLLSNRVSDCSV